MSTQSFSIIGKPLCRLSMGLWLAAIPACAGHSHPAKSAAGDLVSKCTGNLLTRSARFDSSRIAELPGQYRLVWVDTVSTRTNSSKKRLPQWQLQRDFRLWKTDSALVAGLASRPGIIRPVKRPVGAMSGAVVGFDTAGFSAVHPQIELVGKDELHLVMLYHSSVGMLDDGHGMESLPIQFIGKWGFGGYYSWHDLIVDEDIHGKLIPLFDGYYCAFRIPD